MENETITAFAFKTGKVIEEIIIKETNNLKEQNQLLEAKLLELLIDVKNMAEGIHADLEAGNIPNDLHELDIELYRNFSNKYKS